MDLCNKALIPSLKQQVKPVITDPQIVIAQVHSYMCVDCSHPATMLIIDQVASQIAGRGRVAHEM